MQSMPDTRSQSFDELYGPPENFLEIEVNRSPPPSCGSTSNPLHLIDFFSLSTHIAHPHTTSHTFPLR